MWRHLPGPRLVRALLATALLASAVVLLFTVVFPWADRTVPWLRDLVDAPRALSPVPTAALH